LGGKPAPAVGFAIGVERLLDLCSQQNQDTAVPECQVYMVHQGDAAQRKASVLAEQLRDQGLNVLVHAGSTGFKSQFKRADASGAVVAVMIGENELGAEQASVRRVRSDFVTVDDQQRTIALEDIASDLKARSKSTA